MDESGFVEHLALGECGLESLVGRFWVAEANEFFRVVGHHDFQLLDVNRVRRFGQDFLESSNFRQEVLPRFLHRGFVLLNSGRSKSFPDVFQPVDVIVSSGKLKHWLQFALIDLTILVFI